MVVTALVLKPLTFWLKAPPFGDNMLFMLVTELVAQLLTVWSKATNPLNVASMSVTELVTQPLIFWLKRPGCARPLANV